MATYQVVLNNLTAKTKWQRSRPIGRRSAYGVIVSKIGDQNDNAPGVEEAIGRKAPC